MADTEELDALVTKGTSTGLTYDELNTVARAAAGSGLRFATRRRLLKALNPLDQVPSECAVQLLGGFTTLDESSRNLVLKWISLVLQWFDDSALLHQLFPVLFHYLDYAELRYGRFLRGECGTKTSDSRV
jgi:hypothetical protein